MRFSFPVRRSGIGNSKSDNEQKQEDEGEDSAQVDPGILTGEISKIMREIDYPPLARRMGMQGTVSFQLDTDADGKVSQMVLLQSSGYDLLDRTAAERLRSWTFPFYNRRFIIPVRFVLQ
jgi:TonB family protein